MCARDAREMRQLNALTSLVVALTVAATILVAAVASHLGCQESPQAARTTQAPVIQAVQQGHPDRAGADALLGWQQSHDR